MEDFGSLVAADLHGKYTFHCLQSSEHAQITENNVLTWVQLNGSAYRKHRNGAYGSREFCANSKPILWVSGKLLLLRMRTPRY